MVDCILENILICLEENLMFYNNDCERKRMARMDTYFLLSGTYERPRL